MNDKHQNLLRAGVDQSTMPIPSKNVVANSGAQSIITLFKIPLGGLTLVKATIFAKGVATSQRAAYELVALLKNIGGTTTIVSATVAAFTAEDTVAWNATIVANDTKDSADLQVTPDVTVNTIFWGYASAQQV
jgi:hypothetical protein